MVYGFRVSIHDKCLFVLNKGDIFLVLIVYVDDILLNSTNKEENEAVKQFLHQESTIKDLRRLTCFWAFS